MGLRSFVGDILRRLATADGMIDGMVGMASFVRKVCISLIYPAMLRCKVLSCYCDVAEM
jgi:hypothetical protein